MENKINDFTWDENTPTTTSIIEDEIVENEDNNSEKPENEKENKNDNENFIWDETEENAEVENDVKDDPVIEEFRKLIPEDIDEELEPDEIVQTVIEKKVKEKLDEMFSNLPDMAVKFNEFVLKGGNPEEFINTIKSDSLNTNMNLETEEEQEKVLRTLLRNKGYDDDYIEMEIQLKKDSGLLEKASKKEYEVWKNIKMRELDSKIKNKEDEKIKNRKLLKEKKILAKKLIENNKTFNIRKTDKTNLPSYIYDSTEKIGDKSITPMEKDLLEYLNNDEKKIELALFLKYGIEDLKKIVNNKVVEDVRERIKNSKKVSSSKSINEDKIPLWEKF